MYFVMRTEEVVEILSVTCMTLDPPEGLVQAEY
jgi:hypothetical protein